MKRTKEEIIDDMAAEIPFVVNSSLRPYLYEAMGIYANQEAKAYANWLCNQAISGRTTERLWADYQFELNS